MNRWLLLFVLASFLFFPLEARGSRVFEKKIYVGVPQAECVYVVGWPGIVPRLTGLKTPFSGRIRVGDDGWLKVEVRLVDKGTYRDVFARRRKIKNQDGVFRLLLGPTSERILEGIVFSPNVSLHLYCLGKRYDVPIGPFLASEGSVWRFLWYMKAMERFSSVFLRRAFSWDRRLFAVRSMASVRREWHTYCRVNRSILGKALSRERGQTNLGFFYGAVGSKPLREAEVYLCKRLESAGKTRPSASYPSWLRFPVFEARLPTLAEVLRTPRPIAADVVAARFYHAVFCEANLKAAVVLDPWGRWEFKPKRPEAGRRYPLVVSWDGAKVRPEFVAGEKDRVLLEMALARMNGGTGGKAGSRADLYDFDPFTLHVLTLAEAWKQRGLSEAVVFARAMDYLVERTSFWGPDQLVLHGIVNPFEEDGDVLIPGGEMAFTRRGSCEQRAYLTYAVARGILGDRAEMVGMKCGPRTSHYWVRAYLEDGSCVSVSNGKMTSCAMDFRFEPFMLPALLKARFGDRCKMKVFRP